MGTENGALIEAGLDYTVLSDVRPLNDMAADYYKEHGRDVLGLLRDGVLDMEQFVTARDDGEESDSEDVDDRAGFQAEHAALQRLAVRRAAGHEAEAVAGGDGGVVEELLAALRGRTAGG